MFSFYDQFVNYMSVQSLKAFGTVDDTQAQALQTYLDNDRILSDGPTPVEVSQEVIAAADEKIKAIKTTLKYIMYGAIIIGGIVIYFKIRNVVKSK